MPGLLNSIAQIQQMLQRENLGGWLIYDFHSINAIARELVPPDKYHVTRRWYYFIPAQGEPTLLAHKIEQTNYPPMPGRKQYYAGLQEMTANLRALLPQGITVAMEYSPMNDVPTVSYVDAGTIELLRALGVNIVTSAQLIQEFQARWSAEQLQTHIAAAQVLHEAQSEAFRLIEKSLQAQKPINEFEVQRFILEKIAAGGCMSDAAPIVAVNANASNPHYAPTAQKHSPIKKGDVILIDLWAKRKTPGAVFADITWMGFAGMNVPSRVQEVFDVVTGARDTGVRMIQEHAKAGEPLQGYRIDEAVRLYITEAGFGKYFFHRTGHSLGMLTHDNGVNIDSYETRDTRLLTPGIAFSIEPGIYLEEFGTRSEINVYIGANGPEIHTPMQTQITKLAV